jgi:prolyl-tRNA editing enzyme YbaK/EbsC (Cys-tRNA(Pro) deacylase)
VGPNVTTYLDVSLQRFDTVFPAAGSSNSAIEVNCEELEQLSNSLGWVDVCKGWQSET